MLAHGHEVPHGAHHADHARQAGTAKGAEELLGSVGHEDDAEGHPHEGDQAGNLALLAFVQQGGQTFQILAYTPAPKYQAMVNTFLASVQSFAPLTEASKLNVQPARVGIVKLTRDMTIDAFYKAYPSKIPFEYVAIINGVEPGALLKAGTSVKQVK